MLKATYDVAVIGGGPAGLAAAQGAADAGAARVALIERDNELGGILQQCIHNGFGLHRFGEELTGPQYASRCIRDMERYLGIDVLLDTTVLEVTTDKVLWTVNPKAGIGCLEAKAVVFAMGCRERTRGAIQIPGERPAGVFTAGTAQRMVNIEGYLPGRKAVILGSGDIGLIMARRLTLEGVEVRAVLEIMPFSNGLTRNIVQCLEDFDIPLYLSHTVTAVNGTDRVRSVTCAQVDEALRPIAGTEFEVECDCLLLSVGLIPENELSGDCGVLLDRRTGGPIVDQMRQCDLPGFFAAGNVLQVHDLVDWVSREGEIAGRNAALYAKGIISGRTNALEIEPGAGVRLVVPQRLSGPDDLAEPMQLFCRVAGQERNVRLVVATEGRSLFEKRLAVAKPSEIVVADVPAACLREIGSAPLSVSLRHD